MKTTKEVLAPGYAVDIMDYGDIPNPSDGYKRYRLMVEMTQTENLGPESVYDPVNPKLYDVVSRTFDRVLRASPVSPGGWDLRGDSELSSILSALRSAFWNMG